MSFVRPVMRMDSLSFMTARSPVSNHVPSHDDSVSSRPCTYPAKSNEPWHCRSPSIPITGSPNSFTTRTLFPGSGRPSARRVAKESDGRPTVSRPHSVIPQPGSTTHGRRASASSKMGSGTAAPAQTNRCQLERSRFSTASIAKTSAKNGVAPMEIWIWCCSMRSTNSEGSHTSCNTT